MRRLLAGIVFTFVVPSFAAANDESAVVAAESGHSPFELGVYSGGFISNYYHQFYDVEVFPGGEGAPDSREELRRLSPLAGFRGAYFMKPWLGVEAELNMILAETKMSKQSASIYGGRLQLVFQLPHDTVIPYVAIGQGFDHVSSDDSVLGSDTDWPVHVGAGARFFVHPSFAIRVDGRLLRAPSQQDPYHLNASLGEFMVGLSWRPSGRTTKETTIEEPVGDDRDTDADGTLDRADKCPSEPEDLDKFEDTDGCPEADNDTDGLADAADKCPVEAEDKDGFEDDNGCPDVDDDRDGITDTKDMCPRGAEDDDNFKDEDGCPDPDNDGDGFADAQDKCPTEAEVINGVDDNDGCADRGNALVVISPDRLDLMENILFKKATLHKDSTNLLGQIGATLRAHPEIVRLRITVHVQPTKKPDDDQRLSEERANAIREWLINYGIEPKRLDRRGFGGTKPLVDPKQKGAAGINERIDLIILERG